MREFEGRTAVVTGGASGIGFALARRFGQQGMRVVLADVEESALHRAAGELAGTGVPVLAVPTDVADPAAVDALAAATLDRFGAVHVVCNNAGVTAPGRTWELSPATWDWVLGVNLRGVINGIRTFVPLLRAQDEGHVINTASMAGLVAGAGFGAYVVSKHGVTAVSECLFRELAAEGSAVGVSVLCPGFVATRLPLSDRNRPAGAATPDGTAPDGTAGAALLDAASRRSAAASTRTPDDIAALALDAVRDGRLWVLTHPDRSAAVTERAAQIVGSRNPEPDFPV